MDCIQHVVNPLTVALNKNGKERLVLDCRHIDPDLFKFKCSFENHPIARQIFCQGDYLFTFDVRCAYPLYEFFIVPYLPRLLMDI